MVKCIQLTALLAVLILTACNPLGSNEVGTTDADYGSKNESGSDSSGGGSSSTTVTVDQTDDDNTSTGFGGGTHTGTVYSSGVLTLGDDGTNCDASSTNCAELDESWTPQWSNLVSYWKFDETSWNGTANEVVDSKGSNHGTAQDNATTTTSAKIGGYAGTFDGTDDLVNIGADTSLDFTTGLTISLWLKRTASISDVGLIAKTTGGSGYDGYFLWIVSNTVNVYMNGATRLSSSTVVTQDEWTHYVATWNGSTIVSYINGVFDSSASYSTAPASTGHDFWIGSYDTSGGHDRSFTGQLDDVAIWGTALTSDEVALIYSRQSAKYAGKFESRVMDSQNSSSSWTNLDWITTLPFFKELPDGGGSANSESSSNYTSLVNDSLMDGLVGLWHMKRMSAVSVEFV